MAKSKNMRLDPKALALAGGILWGAGAALLAWIAMATNMALPIVELLSHGYIGMAPTFVGGLIAGAWGFIDAGIGCWLFAHIYNRFL